MAFVMQPTPLEFHPAPVSHSPSPLGFSFGLTSPSGSHPHTPATGPHASPFHHLASVMSAASPSATPTRKRRHEVEEDEGEHASRDVSMGRSPTPPERPRKPAPKRFRPQADDASKMKGKERAHDAHSDADVDVGVLLATLPPTALLPILNQLLANHPQLRPQVLSLIPRPTLDTVLQGLAQAAKKLRDAYPFSNAPNSGSFSTSFGFGSAAPSTGYGAGSTGSGFAQTPQTSLFEWGAPSANQPSQRTAQRDEYILSRLRQPISEFVSACFSYLPYFSYAANASQHSTAQSRPPPNEVYSFLYSLTSHILAQPAIAQAELGLQLSERLGEEWKAWVTRLDAFLNREGGMVSAETARTWVRGLDELVEAKQGGLEVMAQVRHQWIASVGWLVGMRPQIQL